MLFTARPHYDSEFWHPAMRIFQQPKGSVSVDFEDLIFPKATMMALCGSNTDDLVRAKNTQNESISHQKSSYFDVKLDVQHFSPEELDVTTLDNFIVVTGKHGEKQDDLGYISREFVRRYTLPEGVKADDVTCNMSSDGILQISAPLQIENTPEQEINIPISLTGASVKLDTTDTSNQCLTETHEDSSSAQSSQ